VSFSLHAATVPSYLQMLGSVLHLLDKAETHRAEAGTDFAGLIGARLADDMHPFAYQVKSAVVHSLGAIEGVRRGEFSPDRNAPPETFAELRARVSTARDALAAIDPAEIESFIGRNVHFIAGDRSIDFTAENFLLSFAQPNFYFHVTTAYAILRAEGVPIGKRDYLGAWRKKA
jgi:hypothetical protein